MISKLLVANRGEIAARVMRTAHVLGIATVAVHSDPDTDAPYVRLADEAVRLPGAASADTYLRGDLIIAAALATGADAVHPGYGFLSENAGFARDCAAAGLTFVGPSPEAIAAMGSKIEAKALMEAAGMPVLPGATVPDDAPDDATGTDGPGDDGPGDDGPGDDGPGPAASRGSPSGSGTRCWSRPRSAAAAAGCGWCGSRPRWPTRWPAPAGRPGPRSATGRCSWSGPSSTPARRGSGHR